MFVFEANCVLENVALCLGFANNEACEFANTLIKSHAVRLLHLDK
jgi:hypothetical protein